MIQITQPAHQELIRFHSEELVPGEFIRIARAYQCGGPRFQLTVDDSVTAMDDTLQFEGYAVVIDKTCNQLLDGCQLDFTETGFVFYDNLHNAC